MAGIGFAFPIASLQLLSSDAPYEPNPLAPILAYGFESDEAWERVRSSLARVVGTDEAIVLVRWGGSVEPGTFGSLRERPMAAAILVPAATAEHAERSLHGLRALVHRLRAPGGCPWDREQTHESLTRFVIEEAYEVADAIRNAGEAELAEELGDLLLQVFLQAEIAEENGDFSLNDVVAQISAKLIRRHPHVFGDVVVADAAQVEQNWERLKSDEKRERKSALDGIPTSLPSLMAAQEIQRRLKKARFDWPDRWGVDAKLDEELAELRSAASAEQAAAELGDVMFILARLALDLGADAEEALRSTNARVRSRFRYVESRLREVGKTFEVVPLDESLALWNEAKATESKSG